MRPAPLVLRLLRQRGFIIQEVMMKKLISLLLCAAMILGLASCGGAQNNTVPQNAGNVVKPEGGYRLSSLTLPKNVPYPSESELGYDSKAYDKAWRAWNEQASQKNELAESYKGKLSSYLHLSSEYLKGHDGQNAVCSPLNIYMALAMLAECAQGNTRTEILNVLGAADLEELRTVARALWEQSYYASDSYTLKLAASIWLNETNGGSQREFNKETIASLAMYYYAEVFSGDARDKEFSKEFKQWLSDNTGGLLKEQAEALDDFDEDIAAAIATTIYFKGSWAEEFGKSATYDEVFHRASGNVEKPFMHKTDMLMTCTGDGFSAVYIPFAAAGGMWIMLPDEGISPEKLNADGVIYRVAADALAMRNVALSLPKFDADLTVDLIPILRNMGINDVFDPGRSDLSGLLSNSDAYVSDVTHAARVKIDEEGCEAAAFTVIAVRDSAMMPQDSVEFKVDRPFAFAITGSDGLPLFTGIINNP